MKIKFAVAGTQYTMAKFLELEDNQPVTFVPDPNNKFDPKAIQIITEHGDLLGYVPKTMTSLVKGTDFGTIFSVCADAYNISIHVQIRKEE